MLLATEASAMVRPAYKIRAAIREAAPHLSEKTVRLYEPIIRREAREHHFDPYTEISIVRNESRFNQHLVYVTQIGEHMVGLGQVRLENNPICQGGSALLTDACQRWKASLLNGTYNLKHVAFLITENRKMCRSRTGQPALFPRWLSSYQGYNGSKGRRGVICNMRKVRGRWRDVAMPQFTRQVIQYRRHLVRKIG